MSRSAIVARARVGRHQRREHAQERRLARAVRSEEAGDLAVGRDERDVVDRVHLALLAERLGQALDADHGEGARRFANSGGGTLFSK